MKNMKLTSVKILKSLYDKFKLETVNTKMSLQKITNRSIYLYISDDKFKEKIDDSIQLEISGSSL